MANSKLLNNRQKLEKILEKYCYGREDRERQELEIAALGFKNVQVEKTGPAQYMTFEEYKSMISQRAKDLEPRYNFSEDVKKLMLLICQHKWQDPEFEKEGYSLNKGLYIAGNIGVGKTTLARIFQPMVNEYGRVVNTMAVCDTYQAHGIEYLRSEYGIVHENRPGDITFDDFGAERIPVQHMGNPLNVMERIILHRYEYKSAHRHTHFTSNIDAEGVEKLYGSRIASRLAEMVNFIVYPGTDRRK